jgi:hypothetical protein
MTDMNQILLQEICQAVDDRIASFEKKWENPSSHLEAFEKMIVRGEQALISLQAGAMYTSTAVTAKDISRCILLAALERKHD